MTLKGLILLTKAIFFVNRKTKGRQQTTQIVAIGHSAETIAHHVHASTTTGTRERISIQSIHIKGAANRVGENLGVDGETRQDMVSEQTHEGEAG